MKLPSLPQVVFDSPEAMAGKYHAGVFRLGDGCDAAATTAVRIEVPESIVVARPQPKPGWTVRIERVARNPGYVRGTPAA